MPFTTWGDEEMALFGKPSDAVEGEIKELTTQFHITLRANFARAQSAGDQPRPETLNRLRELMNADRAESLRWADAYEIEQML